MSSSRSIPKWRQHRGQRPNVKENPNWYQQMKIVDVRTRRPALAPSCDVREESGTWTVYDCQSGCAAALNGVLQVGLGLNEADDLAAVVCTENLIRVDDVMESPKLAE